MLKLRLATRTVLLAGLGLLLLAPWLPSGSSLEGQVARPGATTAGQPYTIGAWYFATWTGITVGKHPHESEQVYGRYDTWGGVRDHALGRDPWKLGVNYSYREPLLGFYDMMSQEIVDAHIQMAASRGLSYFAFYWSWEKGTNEESPVSLPIRRFLSSRYKQHLKFMIAPFMRDPLFTPKSTHRPMTLEMWQNSVVPFMVKEYITDPSYLLLDGRPVIANFKRLTFATPAEDRKGLAILRAAVREKMGVDPLILDVPTGGQSATDLARKSGTERRRIHVLSFWTVRS